MKILAHIVASGEGILFLSLSAVSVVSYDSCEVGIAVGACAQVNQLMVYLGFLHHSLLLYINILTFMDNFEFKKLVCKCPLS